ncbi:MAG: cellulase family glycosylhydrolase [Oscillospiraceae bacterium]
MKMTIKGIFSAVMCFIMLCGCAQNEAAQSGLDTSAGTTASTSAAITNSSQDSTSPADSTSQTPASTDAPQDTTTAATTQNTPDEPQKSAFSVDWKINSTWEEGGMKCGGYEVVITNNTGAAFSGWTLTADVPGGFELSASWNGFFSVSGNKLTVSNESYNGEIAQGGTAGFGFNYRCGSDFTPANVQVNGNTAEVGSGSGNSNSGGNDTPAQTTTATTAQTAPPAPEDPEGTTPVAAHGQLSVKGAQLVDENGNAYQLRGMSTHGITWFPDFVNENSFRTLRDDWNTNVVRLAMYVDEWGNGQCYMQNKDGSRQLLEKGVDICIKLGMYVIIDWHVLNPGDPSKYTDEAISFFTDISKKYADYPNIIYEIANEPNSGAGWSDNIKPYAEKVIPVIRKNDKDAVIIVGTPTWSQDIDQALADPLNCDNVMYALHFYAATHTDWLRERLEKCVTTGLPVFVSEFGCCDASGGGANDFGQSEKWLNLLDKYGISYCNWSLANKAETCSAFKPSASADGNWSDSDYSEVGAWIRNWFRSK